MSASRKQRAKEEPSVRPVYIVLGAVCAACVLALLIWNSNLLRNNAAAVTINGEKFTAADLEYYYSYLRQYQAYYVGDYDYSVAAREQMYDESKTWHEYFLEQSIENLTQDVALAAAANAEGYTMSQESAESLQSALTSLEKSWITSGYSSVDAYLRASYGSGMSYKRYQQLLERDILASDYASAHGDSAVYSDAELQACYEENRDTLDSYTLDLFAFRAAAVEAEEATEDSPAVEAVTLEESRAQALENAQALMSRLEAGEDPDALSVEFEDSLYYSYTDQTYAGSLLSGAEYGSWLFDSTRKTGDVTLSQNDGESNSYYYVIRFRDRYLDEEQTATVRHILVSAGDLADSPDEEAFAQALTQAEELLEQWKSGEATEESFAALAEEYSADSGSASDGGLISNISSSSGYVSTFTDWALNPSRKSGDTGIVRNDGSSTVGYHVMYFVDWGESQWQQSARNILNSEWAEHLTDSCTVVEGSGLRYVE